MVAPLISAAARLIASKAARDTVKRYGAQAVNKIRETSKEIAPEGQVVKTSAARKQVIGAMPQQKRAVAPPKPKPKPKPKKAPAPKKKSY